jgi:hypothetical protein
VRCDGLGVAVVDDEPGAGGALVDGRHVHLLAVPRHDPSGAAKQYETGGRKRRQTNRGQLGAGPPVRETESL